jgi:hypothetical protein
MNRTNTEILPGYDQEKSMAENALRRIHSTDAGKCHSLGTTGSFATCQRHNLI